MFKLRLQFFIVMLVICSLLTTGLYLFIKFSFKQDFWFYIEQKETRFAQPLIKDLVKKYHEHKNWQWIEEWNTYVTNTLETETREHMRALLKQNSMERRPPPNGGPSDDRRFSKDEKFPEPMPPNMRGNDARENRAPHEWRELRRMPPISALQYLFLLDDHKQLVAGKNLPIDDAFLIPLQDDGHTIGYLGIPFNPAVRDLQDADFAQGQEHKLSLVIFIALIIASLAAFPLAHLLTQRINYLVRQVNFFSLANTSITLAKYWIKVNRLAANGWPIFRMNCARPLPYYKQNLKLWKMVCGR